MGDPVVQWQIVAKEPEALTRFYASLFGWRVQTNNALGYREVDTQNARGINGGVWPSPPISRRRRSSARPSSSRNRNCRTVTRWRSCSIRPDFRLVSTGRGGRIRQLTWSFVDMTGAGGKVAIMWGKTMASSAFTASN